MTICTTRNEIETTITNGNAAYVRVAGDLYEFDPRPNGGITVYAITEHASGAMDSDMLGQVATITKALSMASRESAKLIR